MRSTLLSRPFILLFLQTFVFFTGANLLNVLPDHLEAIGASKTYIGLFMNIGSLALVILVVPLSHWTDRIGRRALMLAGYLTALAATGAMFFLADSLEWLMVLRFLTALLFCAAFTINGAEAFGLFPREQRMTGMALFGISGLLSNPVSALIGEAIIRSATPPWLFVASFGFLSLGLVLVLAYRWHKPPSQEGKSSFLGLMGRRQLWPLLAMTLMIGGAFSVFSSFLANLTRERLDMVQISVFFSAFSAVAIALRLLVVPRLSRLPANLTAAFCFLALAGAFALTWRLDQVWQLVPVGLLFGISSAVLFPLLSTLIVNSGGDQDRLGLNNLFASTNTLGNILIAMAMGALADWQGLGIVFLAMSLMTLAVVVLAFFTVRKDASAPS